MSGPRVIVALDFSSADAALAFAARLEPRACRLKVGKELFTAAGPALVEKLAQRGFDIFLDLKFHDIPHTVAGACRAAAQLGVWMLNVHALGGRAMLEAAREAVAASRQPPQLIAVTLLTSMAARDLADVGIAGDPAAAALKLARLAQASGLDGVVCSAWEAALLKRECGEKFCLVTPGIRPATSAKGDQQRVMTPADAVVAGADYLVIGRPVTRADDPLKVLEVINTEVAEASLRAHAVQEDVTESSVSTQASPVGSNMRENFLNRPMRPSRELAAIIGDSPMSRGEVTKRMWVYIKSNRLQDATNKRMINADEKLRLIFGGKSQVSMFDMIKMVSNHLKKT